MVKDNIAQSETTPVIVLEDGHKAAKTLIRNSTFYLGADSLVKILSFAFNIYVVRQLGDERFGFYSTALAYAGIFSIIGDLGMTQYAMREIARGRRTADDFFWNLVALRLILSTLATILITGSAFFIAGYTPQMVLGIFLVCVGFYFHAFYGPMSVIFAGHERIDYISMLDTLIQIFFVTMGTWVLLGAYSFHSLIVASYIGVPVAAFIAALHIKRLKLATLKLHITPSDWISFLKYSIPFALITFTLLVGRDIDTVLLSLWRPAEEVGWYRAAYNLTFKLLFIRGALLSTLTPQMSRYYGVSANRVAKTFNTSFKILWAFSFPIAVGGALLANPIVTWLYTDEFARSGIVLAVLIWSLPLLNLSSLCGSITTATDKENKAARVYVMAALFNLGVNIVAIPIWGYIGAAVATVITEAVALLLFYTVLHHEFPLTDLGNTLFKPFLAGTIMGGVIYLLPTGWPLILLVTIGVLVYTTVLFAMKPFNPSEIEIIQTLWLSIWRRLKPSVS